MMGVEGPKPIYTRKYVTSLGELDILRKAAELVEGVDIRIVSKPRQIYTPDLGRGRTLEKGQVGIEFTTGSFEKISELQSVRNRLRSEGGVNRKPVKPKPILPRFSGGTKCIFSSDLIKS